MVPINRRKKHSLTAHAPAILSPLCCRMLGRIEMNQTSRSDFQGDKYINDVKGRGQGGEEVASHDCLGVVFQESGPALVSRFARPGSCLRYLATVRGDSRIWSFNNSSSAMRFCPQLGFSAARRRIKFFTSLVTCGLPSGFDLQRQKRRSAARCQPIKVAGLTITNALRQSNQRASFENTNLSVAVSSRVPEIEPTVCAGTDFPLSELNGGTRY
jgi:hypothetical protein